MEHEYSIKDGNKEKIIETDAGRFVMPTALYDKYKQSTKPTKEDFPYIFANILARSSIPESYAYKNKKSRWYDAELDEKVRQMVQKTKIDPTAYLSKYHESNNKTAELWDLLDDEILDLMARNTLFFKFSSGGIDRMTTIEHHSIGGSHGTFFSNPFMGGYSRDERIIEKARRNRESEVLNTNQPALIGLFLYLAKEDFRYGEVRSYYSSARQLKNLDQTNAKKSLAQIYEHSKLQDKAPKDIEGIDYARIVLKPVQYDSDLMAVPEAVSLDFIANKELIAQNKDPKRLESLRIRKEDLELSDVVNIGSEKTFVRLSDNGSQFNLVEVPTDKGWFERYHSRIFKE